MRKWFGHKAEKFEEFEDAYKEELSSRRELLKEIKLLTGKKPVTLLYGAKDPNVNHAVVLKSAIDALIL